MEENWDTKVPNYKQILNITFFGFRNDLKGIRINFAVKKRFEEKFYETKSQLFITIGCIIHQLQ